MPRVIDELIAELETKIPRAMTRLGVPGLAIGICDGERTLWSSGYGTTIRGGGAPITPATSFSVQSTSKLFTATVVLLAVQRSLVSLDDLLAMFIPDFSVHSLFDETPAQLITLRHCLSHTAGLTHEAPLGSNYDLGNGDFEAHCQSICDTWLRFPVGHHYEYSNLGIDLAGYAVQRASGIAFAEFAKDVLFEPLELRRTTFDSVAIEADTDRAIGHWRLFEDAGRALPVAVPMVAAGGLYTTVEDALRFVRLYLGSGESLLEPRLIGEQCSVPFAPLEQELGYGLGLYIDEWSPGVRVYHHGGSGFGFQSQLCWSPDLEIGVVVLTNSFDHALQNELARQIIEHVAGPGRTTSNAQAAPARLTGISGELDGAADLVGEYVGRLGEPVELTLSTDRLLLTNATSHDARVIAPRTIEIEDALRGRYRFTRGADGSIAYMHAMRDGETWYRNPPPGMPPSTLDPVYAGIYAGMAWGVPAALYEIHHGGDSPVIAMVAGAYDDPTTRTVSLRLTEVAPGLYISSTGEMLDLRSAAATYANIPLVRASCTVDPE